MILFFKLCSFTLMRLFIFCSKITIISKKYVICVNTYEPFFIKIEILFQIILLEQFTFSCTTNLCSNLCFWSFLISFKSSWRNQNMLFLQMNFIMTHTFLLVAFFSRDCFKERDFYHLTVSLEETIFPTR